MARNFHITGNRQFLSRTVEARPHSLFSPASISLAACSLLLLTACQDQNSAATMTELPPESEAAVATLAPVSGSQVAGEVRFYAEGDSVLVAVQATGLESGMHGFHIHENGDCSAPDASSAGGHFAPEGHPHGAPSGEDGQHHAGDMGNIRADGNGVAMTQLTLDDLSLDNPNSIVGKAVIIHAMADDLQTQPSGDSGNPVACGVIQPPMNA